MSIMSLCSFISTKEHIYQLHSVHYVILYKNFCIFPRFQREFFNFPLSSLLLKTVFVAFVEEAVVGNNGSRVGVVMFAQRDVKTVVEQLGGKLRFATKTMNDPGHRGTKALFKSNDFVKSLHAVDNERFLVLFA